MLENKTDFSHTVRKVEDELGDKSKFGISFVDDPDCILNQEIKESWLIAEQKERSIKEKKEIEGKISSAIENQETLEPLQRNDLIQLNQLNTALVELLSVRWKVVSDMGDRQRGFRSKLLTAKSKLVFLEKKGKIIQEIHKLERAIDSINEIRSSDPHLVTKNQKISLFLSLDSLRSIKPCKKSFALFSVVIGNENENVEIFQSYCKKNMNLCKEVVKKSAEFESIRTNSPGNNFDNDLSNKNSKKILEELIYLNLALENLKTMKYELISQLRCLGSTEDDKKIVLEDIKRLDEATKCISQMRQKSLTNRSFEKEMSLLVFHLTDIFIANPLENNTRFEETRNIKKLRNYLERWQDFLSDPTKKFFLCMRLAKEGDIKSQFELAKFYQDGYIMGEKRVVDLQKAIKYYELVASRALFYPEGALGEESIIVSAMYRLFDLYIKGGEGIEDNVKDAWYWCKKAAAQKHTEAQFCLAEMYENTGSMELALPLYREAAERGNLLAQCKMGDLYLKEALNIEGNESIVGCYRKADYWYQKAEKCSEKMGDERILQEIQAERAKVQANLQHFSKTDNTKDSNVVKIERQKDSSTQVPVVIHASFLNSRMDSAFNNRANANNTCSFLP